MMQIWRTLNNNFSNQALPIMKFPELSFSERADNKISFLIIHCCAFPPKKAVQSFVDNDVSAHYIISGRGNIYSMVDDKKCAWHAGKSFWGRLTSLNKNSILLKAGHFTTFILIIAFTFSAIFTSCNSTKQEPQPKQKETVAFQKPVEKTLAGM